MSRSREAPIIPAATGRWEDAPRLAAELAARRAGTFSPPTPPAQLRLLNIQGDVFAAPATTLADKRRRALRIAEAPVRALRREINSEKPDPRVAAHVIFDVALAIQRMRMPEGAAPGDRGRGPGG